MNNEQQAFGKCKGLGIGGISSATALMVCTRGSCVIATSTIQSWFSQGSCVLSRNSHWDSLKYLSIATPLDNLYLNLYNEVEICFWSHYAVFNQRERPEGCVEALFAIKKNYLVSIKRLRNKEYKRTQYSKKW